MAQGTAANAKKICHTCNFKGLSDSSMNVKFRSSQRSQRELGYLQVFVAEEPSITEADSQSSCPTKTAAGGQPEVPTPVHPC